MQQASANETTTRQTGVDMSIVRERASLTLSLNNRAVKELAEGRYEDAIVILARALRTSKRALFHFEGTHRSLGNVTLTGCMMRTIKRRPSSSAASRIFKQREEGRWIRTDQDTCTGASASEASSSMYDDCDESFRHTFLYRHGIMMPSNLPICYESSVLLSVAIIFNLALSYQLVAMRDPAKQERYLRKASKLYELAHDLQCDEGLDSVLLIAACVNNLGVIFRASGDEYMAGKYFDHLLATIMFMTVNGDESQTAPCMSGFMMNATEKHRHHNAAAAA